jgi:signal transduction histidine kinase
MKPSYRVLRLPALAVLLPCIFIAVLSSKWLTLEREAAAHRDSEAGQRLVADLRHDLLTALRETADLAVRELDDVTPGGPLFQPPTPVGPLVSEVWLFTASGALMAPLDPGAALTHAIEQSRQELATSRSRSPAALAASHLQLARRSLAAGDAGAAERRASEIARCCPGARDEHGMSFSVYGAWLRIVASEGQPWAEETVTHVARELRQLIDEGYLGAPGDATQLALLAARAKDTPALARLVPGVEAISSAIARRADLGRLAAQWVAQSDLSAANPARVLIRSFGSESSVAALSTATDGRAVVMLIDADGLDRWIRQWAAGRDAFTLDVRRSETHEGAVTRLAMPLFLEAPAAAMLVLAPLGSHPVTERRRRQLFIAAVVVVILLTAMIGYLAARDVSREVATAALRSTFVAGVTHELKTPLASIRLLAETIRQGRTRPGTTGELLDTIVEETDRLSRLVDNVLSSSRMESGTRSYNPQPVSLAGAVRAALGRFDYVLQNEGFTADLRIDGEGLDVHVDPDALGQALLNLLGNAVKYSGESRTIRVSVAPRGACGVVAVADDGPGIPKAVQGRIFESFYRAPGATVETTGAGLGLALVRHFAEAHAGRVTVQSEPGRGSVFSIILPLCSPCAPAERGVASTPDIATTMRHG